jgi:AraC-like DNA-binding protein
MAAQPDPIRKWRDTLLTETYESERRISDIALEAGFSDISHFNWPFVPA